MTLCAQLRASPATYLALFGKIATVMVKHMGQAIVTKRALRVLWARQLVGRKTDETKIVMAWLMNGYGQVDELRQHGKGFALKAVGQKPTISADARASSTVLLVSLGARTVVVVLRFVQVTAQHFGVT